MRELSSTRPAAATPPPLASTSVHVVAPVERRPAAPGRRGDRQPPVLDPIARQVLLMREISAASHGELIAATDTDAVNERNRDDTVAGARTRRKRLGYTAGLGALGLAAVVAFDPLTAR